MQRIVSDRIPLYVSNYAMAQRISRQGIIDIEEGTVVKIHSNAVCQDGSFFWVIELEGIERYIWVPEQMDGITYLTPVDGECHRTFFTVAHSNLSRNVTNTVIYRYEG